jgi:hypothetical protein
MKLLPIRFVLTAVLASICFSASAFTYQGELSQSGSLITGTVDMEFRLFDSDTGVGQVGVTDPIFSVEVADGRFVVELDQWMTEFDGSARWLEVAVDVGQTGAFVVLSPRQPLGPAPYAEYSYGTLETQDLSSVLAIGNGAGGQDITNVGDLTLSADNAERLRSDGTNLTVESGGAINLNATSRVSINENTALSLSNDNAERLSSNGSDLQINSGSDINLTASSDVNIPSNVGLTFGADNQKIEFDFSDLVIQSGGHILLNPSSNRAVRVQQNRALSFSSDDAEAISSDGTNLRITSGGGIVLDTTGGFARVEINGPFGGVQQVFDGGTVNTGSSAFLVLQSDGAGNPSEQDITCVSGHAFLALCLDSDGCNVNAGASAVVLSPNETRLLFCDGTNLATAQ